MGCQFFVITEKIEGPAREDSPIVAAHVSVTWLESLIADQRNADVIYLPWTNDELRAYLAAHSDSEEI